MAAKPTFSHCFSLICRQKTGIDFDELSRVVKLTCCSAYLWLWWDKNIRTHSTTLSVRPEQSRRANSEIQNMTQKRRSLDREKKTLSAMVRMYCHGHHATHRRQLCQSCEELLLYALKHIDKCPFGIQKGACSQCPIHCYKPSMRTLIQEVMRYSGPRMLKRHPVLAVSHLLKKWNTKVTNSKVKHHK